LSNNVQILIQNGDKLYQPVVKEGIEWVTERKGVPGKLAFKVMNDSILDFTEGNIIKMAVDGVNTFYGYIFTKKRDKDGLINVTAYDQLRYLKQRLLSVRKCHDCGGAYQRFGFQVPFGGGRN
jgi:hypothetical protein